MWLRDTLFLKSQLHLVNYGNHPTSSVKPLQPLPLGATALVAIALTALEAMALESAGPSGICAGQVSI